MAASQQINQLAFVLHKKPYRESSYLLTLLTEQSGKVNALVRGVRSHSKLAKLKQAWLQPFQGLRVQWRDKPTGSGLINLYHYEPAGIRFPLVGEASICGLYLNELAYRLVYPSLMSPSLFEGYQQTLLDLAKAEDRNHQAWSLRQFEYLLLSEMGYGIDLTHDSHQRPIVLDEHYAFHSELGWIPQQETVFDNGIRMPGDCLLKFVEQQYCETCLNPLKKLFRSLLSTHLGEQPIQARALFNFQSSVEKETN